MCKDCLNQFNTEAESSSHRESKVCPFIPSFYFHPYSPFVHHLTNIPQPLRDPLTRDDRSCSCTAACSNGRCGCFRRGAGCGGNACRCTDCLNPFNTQAQFFGGDGFRASSCFVDWVKRQPCGEVDFADPAFIEDMRRLIFDRVVGDQTTPSPFYFDSSDGGLRELERAWTAAVTDAEKDLIVRKMFRAGLAMGSKNWFYFSFCSKGFRGEWVLKDDLAHCSVCARCDSHDHSCH
ncbi:uncharacterized protein BDZ99DRAFT_468130 [Mytilinidion resinicola]|uniref:Tesmin/TSO1-like CXC domain-containing protein n=1 Tax=Mytilinidion resinicola TaxID=574789 RepID=A0A6A6Y429_9PEZI|nr:uncharacterized protein BDZ99DRAFT_468130 [Mytilinidion resinicola]KAF2803596.1 hypothetical protein BDZ99DRAFT_468130 [Mytilinidion resinicola]